jgi:hypothetical protein
MNIDKLRDCDVAYTLELIVKKIVIDDFEKKINHKPNDIFIFELENNLDHETCINIIERFEKDTRIYPGVTGGGVNLNVKNTKDLFISTLKEWSDVDKILCQQLNIGLQKYLNVLRNMCDHLWFDSSIKDIGYQVQRYKKRDGFYSWHNDFLTYPNNDYRVITFIWYLNDVNEGGETYFLNGKIIPQRGKLVLFPATWNYLHKGNMPISNDKYIVTGWFLYNK